MNLKIKARIIPPMAKPVIMPITLNDGYFSSKSFSNAETIKPKSKNTKSHHKNE